MFTFFFHLYYVYFYHTSVGKQTLLVIIIPAQNVIVRTSTNVST